MRTKDKVGDCVNKLYDTEEGRQKLADLLVEHGDFQSVDAKLVRDQEVVKSNLA